MRAIIVVTAAAIIVFIGLRNHLQQLVDVVGEVDVLHVVVAFLRCAVKNYLDFFADIAGIICILVFSRTGPQLMDDAIIFDDDLIFVVVVFVAVPLSLRAGLAIKLIIFADAACSERVKRRTKCVC